MQRQKSFQEQKATLYLVATPIGNLQEMTPRAIEILREADVIAAEDTRNTQKLLTHFGIKNRMIAHHLHNERNSCEGILALLRENKNVALVSDAGYPLINDPGETLVKACAEEGFAVVPVSGASAFLAALVASGLNTGEFLFAGFLPVPEKEFTEKATRLAKATQTVIFYEAPHRIKKTLERLLAIMGDRRICLAREMTKIHEEFLRGRISEILEVADELKGEMVVVIEGARKTEESYDEESLVQSVLREKEAGLSLSDAVKKVAKESGMSRNRLYQLCTEKEK